MLRRSARGRSGLQRDPRTNDRRNLPIGTAYAVFTGIGAVGTVLFGIIVIGDSPTLGRLGSIAVIVTGIILLRIFGAEPS